jgi:hypothetical protein
MAKAVEMLKHESPATTVVVSTADATGAVATRPPIVKRAP